MTSQFAPIALFAYRRRRHLAAVLDSLERCPEFSASPVHVFSDGPRDPAAAADVAAVRALLAARKTRNMTIVEAPANRGLANSIIAGVTDLCDRYGRVIVIEDDLIVSPVLLTWFNSALDRYRDADNVWQVSGHQFPAPQLRGQDRAMFLNLSTSWGWATWGRAWRHFDAAATGWDAMLGDPERRRQFDLDDSYPYGQMLERQMRGQVDSWAIRWWWSMFRADALGLFPPRPLVSNIGEDATATHRPSRLAQLLKPAPVPVMQTMPEFPADIAVDSAGQKAVRTFLRQAGRPVWQRALATVLG